MSDLRDDPLERTSPAPERPSAGTSGRGEDEAIGALEALARVAHVALGGDVTVLATATIGGGRVVRHAPADAPADGSAGSAGSVAAAPLAEAILERVRLAGGPLVVDDAAADPAHAPLARALAVRAVAGYPVQGPGGTVLGAVCAVAAEPRPWGPLDLQVLRSLTTAAEFAISAATLDARGGALPSDEAAPSDPGARVQHGLRTPLTSLLGFLDLLLAGSLGELSEDQDAALRRCQTSAVRLRAAIGALSFDGAAGQRPSPEESRVELPEARPAGDPDGRTAPQDRVPGPRWVVDAEPGGATTPLDGFLARSDSIAAALVRRHGGIVETNRALERLVGPAAAIADVVVVPHRPAVTRLVAEAGPAWRTLQAGVQHRDGDVLDCTIWARADGGAVLVLAEPLRTPAENLNAHLLALNEELLLGRRELAAKNRRLRELDELKSMFLASTTHDLKTPLTSVLGYAEILGEEASTAEERRMALTIENSARRALTMINDLLGAAQVMTGELKLERSGTDLMAVVRAAVEAIEPQARAHRLTMSLHGPGSAVACVDERRVLQVLDNLLSNAVKYSTSGGRVDVTCEADGPHVTIAVRDTGIGIPLEEQEQLFGRYFRASTAVERGIFGTGLGLANARSFAEAHGGRLDYVSEPGVGSTFTLVLPREPSTP